MRIVVTGGTGFIGRALVDRLLQRGDTVTAFTRRVSGRERAHERLRWVEWNPEAAGAWQRELGRHDGVAHLAGAAAAGRRYTERVRREILDSRVMSTNWIVEGIGKLAVDERPRVLVCASGVGFYGARGDEDVNEDGSAGRDFLAEVCVAWEAAAREAERYGVRVVSARTGFVLGNGGGALSKLVPLFKSFAGGKLGSGRQWLPWVHLDDAVGAYLTALDDTSLSGPMNVSAPKPVTNAEFSRVLGQVLHRPALLPAPAFALRAIFGDGAEPLLTGQRALPQVLLSRGFAFRFDDVKPALEDLLSVGKSS